MVTITLYRSEYLSISLMALFTLFTLFNFHFGLNLRGQIECSVPVVMGLMDSPSHFLPFSCFLTSSLLQSQFFTWLSQTLIVLLLYLFITERLENETKDKVARFTQYFTAFGDPSLKGRAVHRSDLVGSLGESSNRINLDSPNQSR
nr:hypothetical protein CFP56_05714 [Quercus suber]